MIKLSPRLEQVCELVAKGYSDKEIAIKLEISLETVKQHMWKVKKIFRVPNRTLLALKYLYDRNIILYALVKGQKYVDRFKEVEDENIDR